MSSSLFELLPELSYDPILSALFARMPQDGLSNWVDSLYDGAIPEIAAIRQALQVVGTEGPKARAHLEHQVWCAWREAQWGTGSVEKLPIRLEGRRWLDSTDGHPVVVVTPMTLCTHDALACLARAFAGRTTIVYGEGMSSAMGPDGIPIEIVGGEEGTTQRIRAVLAARGVFCTYADFVYEGHSAVSVPFFGSSRSMSAGLVSLAAGTNLLPAVCTVGEGRRDLVVRFEEPSLVAAAPAEPGVTGSLARTFARLLERLIRHAPEQWLLLPTLTVPSPQMATVAEG